MKERKGVAAIAVALLIPVFLGFLALVFDIERMLYWNRVADQAAMAAAYDAGFELLVLGDEDRVVSSGRRSASKNGITHDVNGDVQINYSGSEVQAVVSKSVVMWFAPWFGIGDPTISSTAIATTEFVGSNCIVGLDLDDPSTINVTGTGEIRLDCRAHSNSCFESSSPGTGSFRVAGTGAAPAGFYTEEATACGDFSGPGKPTVDPSVTENTATMPDPFAHRVEPVVPVTPDFSDLATISSDTILDPGYYASTDGTPAIEISGGTVTFNAGLYIFQGLKITGGCVSGEGITLYNTGSTGITGGTDCPYPEPGVKFVAGVSNDPSGAGTSGIVFWCSSDSPESGTHNLAGNGETQFIGIIYCPTQEIRWGGTHGTGGWGAIFAKHVVLNGTADMTFTGPPQGINIPEFYRVTLIG